MSKLTKALTAAAGNAGGDPLYVEDVFSTYVYDGNGSNRSITNGIDLAGEGGLVWAKMRSGTPSGGNNVLYDTERGAGKYLISDLASAQSATEGFVALTSFNSNGFSLGVDNASGLINYATRDYASWTFRKAKKFFDVQTWTGNSTAGRTIAHNLGSAPAFVMVKRTNATNNWICWHSALTNTQYIQINSNSQAFSDGGIFWNSTTPDASNLTLGNDSGVNGSGSTYVAYLFASDAGGFGDDGSESIIKCGSYTGTSSLNSIACGFEPQFVLVKCSSHASTRWSIFDAMRGVVTGSSATTGDDKRLAANSSDDETAFPMINFTATGFDVQNQYSDVNENSRTYIYIAIRRPMKTPEAGTEVFLASTAAAGVQIATGFNVDLWINGSKDGSAGISSQLTMDSMRGANYLRTTQTAAETSTNNPFTTGPSNTFTNNVQGGSSVAWLFKRATGFMDVVCYTGTGSANTISHNLGVIPELLIGKDREDLGANWGVYCAYATIPTRSSALNTTDPFLSGTITNSQTPTATSVTVNGSINGSNQPNVIYLFATLAGVSKVGSYTGTGSNVNVDCGFSAGARWVMIKRSDTAADWYVWDSVRGIVAGNDPYLLLNSTAAEVTNTDYIDPLSSGFTVTSSAPAALNASGSNYIFLAIA